MPEFKRTWSPSARALWSSLCSFARLRYGRINRKYIAAKMAMIGKKLRGELELVDELAAARSELTWNIENYSTRRIDR